MIQNSCRMLSSKHFTFDLYHCLISFLIFLWCRTDDLSSLLLSFCSPIVSLSIHSSLLLYSLPSSWSSLSSPPCFYSLSPLSVWLTTFCSLTCVRSGSWSRPCSWWRALEQGRRKERWRVAGKKRQRSRSLSPSPLRLHPLPGKYGI